METIKAVFFKPDPQAQIRKCNSLIRTNVRKLDRDIQNLKVIENKTKNLIIQADRRGQRDPSQAKQAQNEIRIFGRELVRTRKAAGRLHTSRAQLQSVGMQVQEAFQVRKLEGSIRAQVGIMKDINTLVRLPELTATMRELGSELMKAGIIEEMVEDSMPSGELLDDDEEDPESEVNKVLGEILNKNKTAATPVEQAPAAPVTMEEEEDEEDSEAMLDQMRGRLEALKS